MATDPNLIRASDQDRDRTANVLREHHGVGRLDAEEFNERLDKVFLAKTMGELEALTADLPAVDPYPLPTSSMPRHYSAGDTGLPAASVLGAMSRGHGRFSPAWQAAWGSWLCTSLVLLVLWVLAGCGDQCPAGRLVRRTCVSMWPEWEATRDCCISAVVRSATRAAAEPANTRRPERPAQPSSTISRHHKPELQANSEARRICPRKTAPSRLRAR